MENNNSSDKQVPDNANEHCPGPESKDAGKSDACEGCPNQQACASAPKGPDPGGVKCKDIIVIIIRECVKDRVIIPLSLPFAMRRISGRSPIGVTCELLDGKGKLLEKVEHSGNHDSVDEVEPIDNEMLSGFKSVVYMIS
ncbi:hypothetical protein Tco_0169001 [Tanacetum coccineum]